MPERAILQLEQERDVLAAELAQAKQRERKQLEALSCAEYALQHPHSDQAFALHAVREALGLDPEEALAGPSFG